MMQCGRQKLHREESICDRVIDCETGALRGAVRTGTDIFARLRNVKNKCAERSERRGRRESKYE